MTAPDPLRTITNLIFYRGFWRLSCPPLRAALTTLALTVAAESHGHSCAEQTLEETVSQTDNIVLAMLLEAHVMDSSHDMIAGTFRVIEVIKGEADDTIVLTTPTDPFNGGGVLMVVAMPYLLLFDSGKTFISSCSGSGHRPTSERIEKVRKMVASE